MDAHHITMLIHKREDNFWFSLGSQNSLATTSASGPELEGTTDHGSPAKFVTVCHKYSQLGSPGIDVERKAQSMLRGCANRPEAAGF